MKAADDVRQELKRMADLDKAKIPQRFFKAGPDMYVYSERLFKSFYRNVPLSEGTIPSKVSAKVDNGILRLELPKKNPIESEAARGEVK